jgi:hypothetical protein
MFRRIKEVFVELYEKKKMIATNNEVHTAMNNRAPLWLNISPKAVRKNCVKRNASEEGSLLIIFASKKKNDNKN